MGEFSFMPWEIMLARLLLAAGAGAVVGVERERRDHPAGFRTMLLVSVGACLFTLVSLALAGEDHDPGRVAAGIITGIGFLGAGAILRHGGSVRGLTSAASIWAVSGVGMAAGVGWWQAVVAGTGLMFVVLTLLKWIERHVFRSAHPAFVDLQVTAERLSLSALRAALADAGHEAASVEINREQGSPTCVVCAAIEHLPRPDAEKLADTLAKIDGVVSVRVG
ncbi:MAG: MgtC/SapB family protein [Armatimonadetes bacterium]|nr:MgtC/SapB family protein [Armatimonadota bacterium]